MSPPEVWGPAVWTLLHGLAENLHPDAYNYVIPSMFAMFKRICNFLPCPECSSDASNFLNKININNYKTKTDFKNMVYLFHNWVNAKKRKQLFKYCNMNKYENINLINVINNFIAKYNTKGNMRLLAESFQRGLVVKEFTKWFKSYYRAFIKRPIPIERPLIKKTEPVTKGPVAKEDVAEQPIANNNTEEISITIIEEKSSL